MNTKQYQQQAKRTCASLGSKELDLAHMALGINTEVVELEEAIEKDDLVNIKEEIGDLFFYVANAFTFLNVEMPNMSYLIPTEKNYIRELYKITANFQDTVKKHIAYGKKLDNNALTEIQFAVMELITYYNFDGSKILDKNIEKLKSRFPEKFTTEKALNRDLKTEREILEK